MKNENKVKQLAVAAAAAARDKGVPYIVYCGNIIQAMLETGWCGSAIMFDKHNAPHGIKGSAGWCEKHSNYGHLWTAATAEQKLTGEYYNIQACFRGYHDYDEKSGLYWGCYDFYELLQTPHYSRAYNAKSIEEYCDMIKQCGYATSLSYTANLLKIAADTELMEVINYYWNGQTAQKPSVVVPEKFEPSTYVIRPGDTLTAISRKFNTTVGDLIRLNENKYPRIRTSNGNYIQAGWTIKLK